MTADRVGKRIYSRAVQEECIFRKFRFGRHKTESGKVLWKGEHRTFIFPGLGVLQRVRGKAKQSVARLIYGFERRPRLKALLDFTEVAILTFNREFERQFRKAYDWGKEE